MIICRDGYLVLSLSKKEYVDINNIYLDKYVIVTQTNLFEHKQDSVNSFMIFLKDITDIRSIETSSYSKQVKIDLKHDEIRNISISFNSDEGCDTFMKSVLRKQSLNDIFK